MTLPQSDQQARNPNKHEHIFCCDLTKHKQATQTMFESNIHITVDLETESFGPKHFLDCDPLGNPAPFATAVPPGLPIRPPVLPG